MTTDRSGFANAAYSFNGSSNYIRVLDDGGASLDLMNDYTMSCWVKINSLGTSNPHLITKHIGNQDNAGSYTFLIAAHDVANNEYFPLNQATPNFNPSSYPADQTYDFNVVDWYHLGVTYNDTFDRLIYYLNGAVYDTVQVQFDIQNTSIDMLFGASFVNDMSSLDYYFNGKMDDIGIWDRALTSAEIQALFSASLPPLCVSPDPVSFTGLGSSYTLADAPVTIVGSPAGGVFIGPGVSGITFDPAAAGVGTHSIQYVYVDGNNCVNAAGQCTEVTLNVGSGGDQMGTDGVRVFPNPNRGQFTVELDLTGLVGLQVYDTRGALVHNEVFQASGSKTTRNLDLSTLAKGSYNLQVRNGGGVVTQQVVIE